VRSSKKKGRRRERGGWRTADKKCLRGTLIGVAAEAVMVICVTSGVAMTLASTEHMKI
jgi:hypothetical protein